MHALPPDFTELVIATLARDDRPPGERARLATLMCLLAKLPPPPDRHGRFADYPRLRSRFVESVTEQDTDALEESFLELYCHLHGHDAPYTREERARLDDAGGYWCHAGGLSPLLKAAPFLGPESVSADFGAGNGLQGLLLQKLYPHRETRQIEISSRLIEVGRELQSWLGIAPERVRWICGDVLEQSTRGLDFLYLYRPVRPTGCGLEFYRRLATELRSTRHRVVVFSVADCLAPLLPAHFRKVYFDGQLTCLVSDGIETPAH